MPQQLELEQTQRFDLSDLNPVFTPVDAEAAIATVFEIRLVEIEINSPDNLTLHIRRDTPRKESTINVLELKRFKTHSLFRENKHILNTRKLKEFYFDTTESKLKEVKVTSKKYKTFKISVHYSLSIQN